MQLPLFVNNDLAIKNLSQLFSQGMKKMIGHNLDQTKQYFIGANLRLITISKQVLHIYYSIVVVCVLL